MNTMTVGAGAALSDSGARVSLTQMMTVVSTRSEYLAQPAMSEATRLLERNEQERQTYRSGLMLDQMADPKHPYHVFTTSALVSLAEAIETVLLPALDEMGGSNA